MQNLLFQHCVIKVCRAHLLFCCKTYSNELAILVIPAFNTGRFQNRGFVKIMFEYCELHMHLNDFLSIFVVCTSFPVLQIPV